jgi:superfamily II DNA or RNA helicase
MKIINLYDFQTASIEALRENIRAGVRNQVLAAPTGSGKCHGRGTPIMLASGEILPVEDIRAGERLMGPDGSPRNVLALGRGREQMYRVTPVKGDSYTVNASHLLSLKLTNVSSGIILADGQRVSQSDDHVTVRADVLHQSNGTARHCLKGWRAPSIERFDRAAEHHYVPAYLLGAWLGNGTQRMAAISKPMCAMVAEWLAWGTELGLNTRMAIATSGCPTWFLTGNRNGADHGNTALRALDVYGLREEKHIPPAYKYSVAKVRAELLAGMIDSDGHIDNGGCDWISKSERMARDFCFVARSLGLACYISKQTKRIRSIGFSPDYWRCSVSGDLSGLPMRDKKAVPRTQIKRHNVTGLKLEPIGEDDYYGFEIDGDRLYLLGDFTVTHNTVIGSHLLDECLNKGKRAVFLCDRISLIDQTSALLDDYGIPHGVIQAQHWRWQPHQKVQVASAATLERRGWPECELIIVDECHSHRADVAKRIIKRDCVVVGLTATPFTKGMGKYYDAVVTVTTTNKLIAEKRLCPFTTFASSEPDMTGAKVVAGEWTDDVAAERSMSIVGDCVAEYLKHGGNKKYIAFGCSVAHCAAIQEQMMAAGVVCELYTYRTRDDERTQMVREFRKRDSRIRGLISVAALSKGFDVPDVECIIMARPLKSSLAEHIQLLGRGLRWDGANPDKRCVVLDLSGNMVRFWAEMCDFFENGCNELDDGKPKAKRKAEPKEKKPLKCPKCFNVHAPLPACPACGFEYPRRAVPEHVAGALVELTNTASAGRDEKQQFWSELLAYREERGYAPGWAAHKYREKFGVWPRGLSNVQDNPSQKTLNWIRSRQIAWSKRRPLTQEERQP